MWLRWMTICLPSWIRCLFQKCIRIFTSEASKTFNTICLWQEEETFEMAITTCTKGTKLTLCFQPCNTQIFPASPYRALLNQSHNQKSDWVPWGSCHCHPTSPKITLWDKNYFQSRILVFITSAEAKKYYSFISPLASLAVVSMSENHQAV